MTTPSPYQNLITIYQTLIISRTDMIIKSIKPIDSINEIMKRWNDITYWKGQIIQLQYVIKDLEQNEKDLQTILNTIAPTQPTNPDTTVV